MKALFRRTKAKTLLKERKYKKREWIKKLAKLGNIKLRTEIRDKVSIKIAAKLLKFKLKMMRWKRI